MESQELCQTLMSQYDVGGVLESWYAVRFTAGPLVEHRLLEVPRHCRCLVLMAAAHLWIEKGC